MGGNRTGVTLNAHSTIFTPFSGLKLIVVSRRRRNACGSRVSPHCRTGSITTFHMKYRGKLLLLTSTAPSLAACTTTGDNVCSLGMLGGQCNGTILPRIVAARVGCKTSPAGAGGLDSRLALSVGRALRGGGRTVLLLGHHNCGAFTTYRDYKGIVAYPGYDVSLACRDGGNELVYRCYKCSRPFAGIYHRYNRGDIMFSKAKARELRRRLRSDFPRTHMLHLSTSAAASQCSFRGSLGGFAGNRCSVVLKARVITGKLSFPGIALINVVSVSRRLCGSSCGDTRHAFSLLARIVNETKQNSDGNETIVRASFPRGRVVQLTRGRSFRTFCGLRVSVHGTVVCPPCYSLYIISFAKDSRVLAGSTSGMFLGVLGRQRGGSFTSLDVVILKPVTPHISGVSNGCEFHVVVGYGGAGGFEFFLSKLLGSCTGSKHFSTIATFTSVSPRDVL